MKFKKNNVILCAVSEGVTAQYTEKSMIKKRRDACKKSSKILGISDIIFLDFPDQGLFAVHHEINLQLEKITIPKIVILNKEYTNLDAKLDYIKRNRFDIGFAHHHDTDRYSKATGIEFTFWPFAFDPRQVRRGDVLLHRGPGNTTPRPGQ